jgi:hypothetical protein
MRVRTFTLAAIAAMLLLAASPRLLCAAEPEEGFDVGKRAPEITGKDVKGKPMKLSDFRDKIVVIDFFGDW